MCMYQHVGGRPPSEVSHASPANRCSRTRLLCPRWRTFYIKEGFHIRHRKGETMVLRWGVIGAGGVARRRTMPAINLARDAELKALMVRDQARADALAEEFGAAYAYSDWRELLANPEVDAVHIATPVYLHTEQVIAAAEAGKHVLCDKPMAMDVAGCREMIAACRANGVHMQVCFLMRFGSLNRRLKQLVVEGRFGKILSARATIFKWLPLDDDSWRVKPELGGGGVLMDLGAHTIDLLSYIVGPPKTAFALCSNFVTSWKAEETASVLLRAESGAHMVIEHSFRAKGGDITVEINGSEASALVSTPPPGGGDATFRLSDSNGVVTEPVPFENYYQLQVEHFADCVAGSADPIAPGEDGLRNIAAIMAAYESARTGREVEIAS